MHLERLHLWLMSGCNLSIGQALEAKNVAINAFVFGADSTTEHMGFERALEEARKSAADIDKLHVEAITLNWQALQTEQLKSLRPSR